MNGLSAMAAMLKRGGLTVSTPAEGPVRLRTTVQPDGDVTTFATYDLTPELVEAHYAAVDAQLAELRRANRQVWALAGGLAGGAGLLVWGGFSDGHTGSFLSWVGGCGTGVTAGGGLWAFLRARSWLKGHGAFGRPRTGDDPAESPHIPIDLV